MVGPWVDRRSGALVVVLAFFAPHIDMEWYRVICACGCLLLLLRGIREVREGLQGLGTV
jgi:hypothetical protein